MASKGKRLVSRKQFVRMADLPVLERRALRRERFQRITIAVLSGLCAQDENGMSNDHSEDQELIDRARSIAFEMEMRFRNDEERDEGASPSA